MRKHAEQRGFRDGRDKLVCVCHFMKPKQILSGFSLEPVTVRACQRLNKFFSGVSAVYPPLAAPILRTPDSFGEATRALVPHLAGRAVKRSR